jgi:hypothetical protein
VPNGAKINYELRISNYEFFEIKRIAIFNQYNDVIKSLVKKAKSLVKITESLVKNEKSLVKKIVQFDKKRDNNTGYPLN